MQNESGLLPSSLVRFENAEAVLGGRAGARPFH